MTAKEVVNLAFEMSTGRIESEKERKEYMKRAFTVQMITEYQFRHNLECLQELYESAGFKDNRKLAERLRTDRKILFGPYENMYIDMIHLLADEITANKELADQYISIFEKRYNINAKSIVEKNDYRLYQGADGQGESDEFREYCFKNDHEVFWHTAFISSCRRTVFGICNPVYASHSADRISSETK